jgi:hypothetical protein
MTRKSLKGLLSRLRVTKDGHKGPESFAVRILKSLYDKDMAW